MPVLFKGRFCIQCVRTEFTAVFKKRSKFFREDVIPEEERFLNQESAAKCILKLFIEYICMHTLIYARFMLFALSFRNCQFQSIRSLPLDIMIKNEVNFGINFQKICGLCMKISNDQTLKYIQLIVCTYNSISILSIKYIFGINSINKILL